MLQLLAIILSVSAFFGFINHKWLKLPTTIGVMLIGVLMGIGLKFLEGISPALVSPVRQFITGFDFSEFVLGFILSFLLFAGSLHVNMADLKKTWASVISYATIGTLISTFALGACAYLVLQWFGLHLDFIVCLLFGALISPTDPIAVIGILSKYNIPKKLKVEIVGESLFNDGVGVVVFTVIYSIMQMGPGELTLANILKIFSLEVIGGIGIGILAGYIGYWLMRSIDHYQTEILISLALVTGGYAVASALHTSGPLAMVVAGLIVGNKGKKEAMSDITADYVDKFWELVDEICNTVLFVLMGLEIFLVPFQMSYLLLGILFIVISLAVRFISLVPAYLIFNRKEPSKMLGLSILTWGGLRGGISVSLALSLRNSLPNGDLLLVLTFCIVLFSILVQGLSIKSLLKKYK